MNAPKLRFKGFNDQWSPNQLDNLVIFYNKQRKPVKESDRISGEYPYYGASGIVGYVNNFIFEGEYLLLSEDGANIVSRNLPIVYRTKDKFWVNNHAHIFKSIDSVVQNYLYHYLEKINYVPFNSGTAQPKLNLEAVKLIPVNLPSYKEQEKLATFFERITKKIQLQQEKMDLLKEQKKGYMQKIFTQELRFKDDRGQEYPNWKKQIKAEQLFDPISNKNHNGEYPVLSATQEHGMVYRDSLDRQMSFNDDNLGSYKLVEPKDFIISLRSFQGGIEYSNLQGLVSPAYTVFRKKNALVNELYFSKLFKTDNFIMRLNATTYGIRDGKAISYKDFSTLKFDVPCLEEQIKIANFLDTFDKKIAHETTKLTQLTYKKQYFMQQMFI